MISLGLTPFRRVIDIRAEDLRHEILSSLTKQGFSINPHLRPAGYSKKTLQLIHKTKRLEVINNHRTKLQAIQSVAQKYAINGADVNPKNIDLELLKIEPETKLSDLYFWWRVAWWSLPYERSIGRHIRFIIWDKGHDAPFGLLGLQSPTIRQPIRDRYLGLDNGNIDYWINQSMYAHTVGALPPYNFLLGSKMVALTLACNEVRYQYNKKYRKATTWMRQRMLPARLLFVTTTSAYGKSPVYERLRPKGKPVCQFLGFTQGSGTFHISDELYAEIRAYLARQGVNVDLGFGTGASRKLRLIHRGLRALGLNVSYHNIPRGLYLFPHANNLHAVIKQRVKPDWVNNPFNELFEYWMERWCLPRAGRQESWNSFRAKYVFASLTRCLNTVKNT